ncbi:hypothetical protein QTO34_000722 [Cnephaeus nilssonii]|uniref:Hyaluronan/mRNA-binding protein domain-containing protein n=1 Tax=Cnephaeus nilssonii TaxID=3371016 RepID=A0AA40LX77_CNENI|nr:hypothetical protein QTO34_000722 [Eptesicus nilssonii]
MREQPTSLEAFGLVYERTPSSPAIKSGELCVHSGSRPKALAWCTSATPAIDCSEAFKAEENKNKEVNEAGGGGGGGGGSDHLVNDDLKSHLKKKVKNENFKLIDRLLTSLSEAVVVLEKIKDEVDMEWAKEIDGFDSCDKCKCNKHSVNDRSFSHYSGLKHEDKCGGSGSHNWGTVKDELTDLEQPNVTEETPEGEEHPVADTKNKENKVEEIKEEGPKEMTLDDRRLLKIRTGKKVKRLTLKIRLWAIISGSQQMI